MKELNIREMRAHIGRLDELAKEAGELIISGHGTPPRGTRHGEATNLINRYPEHPLRTLDASHLAMAVHTGAQLLATTDALMAAAASAMGFEVARFCGGCRMYVAGCNRYHRQPQQTNERELTTMEIAGSKAIFVGGASGMCRATAEIFAQRGGQIAILDLESSDGEAVAKELGGFYMPCNVMDYEGMEKVIGAAVEKLGGLHFCVNTAGGGVAKRTLARDGEMHPLSDFQRIIDLNLIASFNINRVAAKHMSGNEPNEEGERGCMINTASIAAFEGQIGQVAYTAAKAGIAGMTLTMARDLGALGIRVMTIAPSLFATGLTKGIPDEGAQQLTKDAAFPRRMGKPREFAIQAIAIFENPMMNGSTIRVDGGQRFAPR